MWGKGFTSLLLLLLLNNGGIIESRQTPVGTPAVPIPAQPPYVLPFDGEDAWGVKWRNPLVGQVVGCGRRNIVKAPVLYNIVF